MYVDISYLVLLQNILQFLEYVYNHVGIDHSLSSALQETALSLGRCSIQNFVEFSDGKVRGLHG